MNRHKLLLSVLFTVIFRLITPSLSYSQQINEGIGKETFLYSVKDRDSLFLDRYYPVSGQGKEYYNITGGKHPCLIFVFGGGFFAGNRDNAMYIPYYHWLADKGFNVIAIDYRLGLKSFARQAGKTGTKKRPGPVKMVNILFGSVNMAVEDFYDATDFVISRSAQWNIDTSIIIGCGSSAGAITVLQGEYYLTNSTWSKYSVRNSLPENFRYAGIIAFAGAIAQKGGKIKWKSLPAPIQLFHGDADPNVPYDKIKTILGGLYGSKSIAEELKVIDAPHYFFTEGNATHTVAVTPMSVYREQIEEFIDKMVIAGEPLIINEDLTVAGEPVKNKRLGIKDFIKSNFTAKKESITLLSYNVHNCIPADNSPITDYTTIARIIKESNADIVALQELDSMTVRIPSYVLGNLASLTGMYGSYAAAIDYWSGKYGIGILSKEKPLALKHIPLPGKEEKRIFLIAEFGKYIFCSVHLSLTKEDRLASVRIIKKSVKDFIKESPERKNKPVFIGGDFNATPLSETIKEFARIAKPVSNVRMNTFPSTYPDKCIDYIFVMGKKMPGKMEVLSTGRIRDTLTRKASDHLPVYSVIKY